MSDRAREYVDGQMSDRVHEYIDGQMSDRACEYIWADVRSCLRVYMGRCQIVPVIEMGRCQIVPVLVTRKGVKGWNLETYLLELLAAWLELDVRELADANSVKLKWGLQKLWEAPRCPRSNSALSSAHGRAFPCLA
eukprot:Pompholyxophrys_punicea_v1_NODE_15_length_6209_cov_7.334416.p5 type:complete len:136 gc:universal NODE_15_length_6209_cov_7.334416:2398-1991(-)